MLAKSERDWTGMNRNLLSSIYLSLIQYFSYIGRILKNTCHCH